MRIQMKNGFVKNVNQRMNMAGQILALILSGKNLN